MLIRRYLSLSLSLSLSIALSLSLSLSFSLSQNISDPRVLIISVNPFRRRCFADIEDRFVSVIMAMIACS